MFPLVMRSKSSRETLTQVLCCAAALLDPHLELQRVAVADLRDREHSKLLDARLHAVVPEKGFPRPVAGDLVVLPSTLPNPGMPLL